MIAMFNYFITLLQHVRGQSALCCQINVCMYVCKMVGQIEFLQLTDILA